MTWLITGGAGYIGSHVVFEALKSGRNIIVLDDLSTGIKSRLPEDIPFANVTLTDRESVFEVFARNDITGVIHLAAKKQVGESVLRPDYYWEENVDGLQNLVDAMVEHNVKNFVFSSSAAVYGQPNLGPEALISEGMECEPINPYGETKLEGERISEKLAINFDFRVAALRYFNVVGAGKPELGDQFALNLVPIVFEALDRGDPPKVFGDDYQTHDGSCIRDYVHVQDLAEAHVAAMNFVEKSKATFMPINIGTGQGASVFEVIAKVEKISGAEINPESTDRRAGDPAALVADVTRAKELLNWESHRNLEDIISSAWDAWQLGHK
jgi:UDP-glucose 4-epimerase